MSARANKKAGATTRRGWRFPWRWSRRLTQLGFVIAFLVMFRLTELSLYGDAPPGWVNAWFRIDPLVAASAMLAARAFIATLLVSLIVLALTALVGRAFCGWVCPLGTLLDWFGPAARVGKGWRKRRKAKRLGQPLEQPPRRRWYRSLRYMLLVAVLLAAAVGLPLVGYLDPFAILTRGLAFAIDPAWKWGVEEGANWLYLNGSPSVYEQSDAAYSFLQDWRLLPYAQAAFAGGGVAAGMLLVIFTLERVERRFWCRNLCPLGAMLGLVARVSPIKRVPGLSCPGCGECGKMCRMDAFDPEKKRFEPQACNLCMDCVGKCPTGIATFRFGKPDWLKKLESGRDESSGRPRPRSQTVPPLEVSRRGFLAGATAGVALPVLDLSVGAVTGGPEQQLRPPAAVPGAGFLDQCVRCGECIKVCPNQALQPVLLEGGLAGMFAPKLVPRTGYCEYGCTLCSEVCPTQAIQPMTAESKWAQPIGKAEFDTSRCLPYADGEECLCCEEHCPVSEKAIRFHFAMVEGPDGAVRELEQPYVVRELCVGCGICEHVCPLEGAAGVHVRPNCDGHGEEGNCRRDHGPGPDLLPGQYRERRQERHRGGSGYGGGYGY
ncbi:MAG: 4Fe-4S binding protein [Phycisphaeraceae bacterium]